MCGRFANHVHDMHRWEAILQDWPEDVALSYNVAPSQTIAMFTQDGGQGARWGLIPSWSNEIHSKYATFNARIESVSDKPAFRHAWHCQQRCLIPALGYYEWKTERGSKQPCFVRTSDCSPLVFAGLYEPGRDGQIPASCTLLTRPADKGLVGLHSRMPVMLNPEQAETWFLADGNDARELACSERAVALDVYPVSKAVNNPRNQGPSLINPISPGMNRYNVDE